MSYIRVNSEKEEMFKCGRAICCFLLCVCFKVAALKTATKEYHRPRYRR